MLSPLLAEEGLFHNAQLDPFFAQRRVPESNFLLWRPALFVLVAHFITGTKCAVQDADDRRRGPHTPWLSKSDGDSSFI